MMAQSVSFTGVTGSAASSPSHWLRRAGKLGFAFFLLKGLVWLGLMIALWLMQ